MKRLRPMEEDVEEVNIMANCLLLLSNIDQTTAAAAARIFKCKTCNRQFSSYQALGGHRASHRKPQPVHNKETQIRNDGIPELKKKNRGIKDIESGLPDFVGRPNVYQDLRGGASSSRTTNTACTLMGDGGRHDQDSKMKEFRNFAYWITALFITILVSLLSANKRQPEVLFRLCGSLVIGATSCCIAMLMLVSICPSSQRALTCLKMMQYLTIGLLFVVAVLVFTLL